MNTRIHEIDALRGWALFGILMVNIFVFHAPLCYYGEFYGAFEGSQAEVVELVVGFFVGKFLFIFAFLFGYGMVLQEQSRGPNFQSYFIKRMLVLFVFGALHTLLFWLGDILSSYALLGLLALPFIRSSKGWLLTLASFFLLIRPLYYLGIVLWDWPSVHAGQPASLEEFIQVFQTGSYGEIFGLRMKEFAAFLPETLVWYMPKSLGLFFLGIWAARVSLFNRIRKQRLIFGISAIVLLVMSTAWLELRGPFFESFDLKAEPIWRPLLIAINVTFETAMGISYVLLFTVIFQSSKFLTRLISKTGRMALSNYILQSVFCVLIFYGYGLGYFALLKPSDLVLITLVIFAINIGFSLIYLRFRKMGPLEYLWRVLIDKPKP